MILLYLQYSCPEIFNFVFSKIIVSMLFFSQGKDFLKMACAMEWGMHVDCSKGTSHFFRNACNSSDITTLVFLRSQLVKIILKQCVMTFLNAYMEMDEA